MSLLLFESRRKTFEPPCTSILDVRNQSLVSRVPNLQGTNCSPCITPGRCLSSLSILRAPSTSNPVFVTTNFYESISGGSDPCMTAGEVFTLTFVGTFSGYSVWRNSTLCNIGGSSFSGYLTTTYTFRNSGGINYQQLEVNWQDSRSSIGNDATATNTGCNFPTGSYISGNLVENTLTGTGFTRDWNAFVWWA